MELKFYYCKICGKIIAITKDGGTPTVCCGEIMSELIPCTTDGAFEKHVPIIKSEGENVSVIVGSEMHPMIKEHYIEWILLETNRGWYKRFLHPGEFPRADFVIISGEKVVAAYEYCNLHKLWKSSSVSKKGGSL